MKINLLLILWGFVILFSGCSVETSDNNSTGSKFLSVDYRQLISRADLIYNKPVTLSQAGMPIGTGRMGSLVWTSPNALKFQINRADVYAINNSTNSFPIRNSDYQNGCAYVDINLVGYGEDVFSASDFLQHLSVYDGVMTINGKGFKASVFATHNTDVIAVRIEDGRKQPQPVNIDLRMLRYLTQYNGMIDNNPTRNLEMKKNHTVMIATAEHTATSKLNIRDDCMTLTQYFRENKYYNASAVAIDVIGRKSKARYLNESTVQLSVEPGKGYYTILISSSSSFNPADNVELLALSELQAAKNKGYESLLTDSRDWWHNFWSKSFVHLHSGDGKADYLEKRYTFYLYVMGSSSLGDYPPRFINWIFNTNGDQSIWGSLMWWWNQSAAYNGIPSTNHFELMQPLYRMYTRHYDSYAMAARQLWGSKGIWFPETTWFDGFEELPEDIAEEMQDLFLLRKPWNTRSERLRYFASSKMPYESRWNWIDRGHWDQGHWIAPEKPTAPFGHVTHQYSATAKISYLFWQKYAYTMDEGFLRDSVYPMLKGTVEFYRNFPHVKKDSKGKYNIYHTQYSEPVRDIRNSTEEMMSMHGIIPLLIRASEILNVDNEMRPVWKEFFDNLAPISTSSDNSAMTIKPEYWTLGTRQATKPKSPNQSKGITTDDGYTSENDTITDKPCLDPAIYFDIMTVGTVNQKIVKTANATYYSIFPEGVKEGIKIIGADLSPIATAHLGRGEDLKHMLVSQVPVGTPDDYFNDSIKFGILPNHFVLQTGGALDCENTGNFVTALQTGLIQSVPPAPGKESVIYIFPAWPKDWDAAYKLLARGGFLISTAIKKGKILLIEIESQVGGMCRVHNPWAGKTVLLYKNGVKTDEISGELLEFATKRNETFQIVQNETPPQGKLAIPFKMQN